jgi:protein TonB
MAAALSHLAGSRRSHVLVLDTRDMTDVRGDVETAMSQAPGTTMLVFASAEVERSLSSALKGSGVFALLPIPIDKRKTAVTFEGAIADAVAKRGASRGSEPRGGEMRIETKAETGFDSDPIRLSGPDEPPTPQISKTVWIGVAVAVIAVAGGGYFLMSKDETSTPSPSASTAPRTEATPQETAPGSAPAANTVVEVPLVKGRTDELLEKARLAMRERRYTAPLNDNALLFYRSALAAEPSNGEATDGMTRLGNLLITRFEESMTANRYDEASEALGGLKQAMPSDPRLVGLEGRLTQSQINKALGEGNVERAALLVRQAQQGNVIPADQAKKWSNEIARRQDEVRVKRLVDLGSDAIQKGRLTDPGEDSAKAYIAQLKDIPGANNSAVRLQRELVAALLRKAREANVAKAPAEADRLIAEARASGASANDLAAYNREVTAAKQKAATAETDRYAALLRERIRDGRLTEPANDSAMYYLAMLNSADSTGATSTSVGRELSSKLIERARTAAIDGRSAQMDADLAAARRLGADPGALTDVQALASQRTKTAAITPRPTPAQPNKLKRVRYAPPEYPQKAFQQKLTGSVTVEFVVDVNGEPRDTRVVDADPPEVFDKAALTAVKKWRYEPVVVNNVPTEVPTRMVIRFELPK